MDEELKGKITIFYQLITIFPIYEFIKIVLEWISKKFQKQRDIYLPQKRLICNSALYDRIMYQFMKGLYVFVAIIFFVLIVEECFKVDFIENIKYILFFCISYPIQLIMLGNDNYGLNKHGEKRDYSVSIYLFAGIIDILILISVRYHSTWSLIGNIIGYIIEIGLVISFSLYILNIKKVTYCEYVILKFSDGEEKVIRQGDFRMEENGSVIVTNHHSKEQINESYIRKKIPIYSDEYNLWEKKMKRMSDENSKSNGDKDIQWSWVLTIGLIPVVVSILDFGNLGFKFGLIQQIVCEHNNIVSDLFAQQMTISTIFIAVASLAVNSINDRFVEVSTKCILFKRFIYNPNYITLILILLVLNINSFVAYFIQSKWGNVFSFILSLVFLFRLLSLTYYLLSKKSRIYLKILKRLELEDLEVYKTIMKKLELFVCENGKARHDKHDSYFVEEMQILYKMKEIAARKECKKECRIIEEVANYYIKREGKDLKTLKLRFKDYKDEDIILVVSWIKKLLKKYN